MYYFFVSPNVSLGKLSFLYFFSFRIKWLDHACSLTLRAPWYRSSIRGGTRHPRAPPGRWSRAMYPWEQWCLPVPPRPPSATSTRTRRRLWRTRRPCHPWGLRKLLPRSPTPVRWPLKMTSKFHPKKKNDVIVLNVNCHTPVRPPLWGRKQLKGFKLTPPVVQRDRYRGKKRHMGKRHLARSLFLPTVEQNKRKYSRIIPCSLL